MRFRFIVVLAITFFFSSNLPAQSGVWVWMKGDTAINSPGVFGTQGIPDINNTPPALYEAVCWMDKDGNFWLYGGTDSTHYLYNDLWKYNPQDNEWTWIKGTGLVNQFASYGTIGIPSPSNSPGARAYGCLNWIDEAGDLWLYGGISEDTFWMETFADLWRYNISTNEWTCMGGYNQVNAAPHYGPFQQFGSANTPGARSEYCAAWYQPGGLLLAFGGYLENEFNDMWAYDESINQWAWMAGPGGTGHGGNYGTRNVEAITNRPPPRNGYAHWMDGNGNCYMYGGLMFDRWGSDSIIYNDVWKYNPVNARWTWVAGDSIANQSGHYQTYCTESAGIEPRPRFENRTAQGPGCGTPFLTFGGETLVGDANDLWIFNYQNNQWKWLSGFDSTKISGYYGQKGVASNLNVPPSRDGHACWLDGQNNYWIWGGHLGYGIGAKWGNDLWKFIPDTVCLHLLDSGALNYQLSANQICSGDSALLTISGFVNPGPSPSNSSYWRDSTHIILFPDSTSSYILTGQSSCGFLDTSIIKINVGQLPAVTITASQPIVCSGDSILLCAPPGYPIYLWNNGQTTPCFYALSAGNYYVTVSEHVNCSGSSNTLSIDFYPSPPVSISFTGDTLSVFSATTVQWLLNGSPINGATSNIYIAHNPGAYTVQITDSNGCSSQSNPVLISTISEISDDEVLIYPNPSLDGNWILQTGKSFVGSNLCILDANGRIVFKSSIQTARSMISVPYASGIYVLKIESDERNIYLKIIKL